MLETSGNNDSREKLDMYYDIPIKDQKKKSQYNTSSLSGKNLTSMTTESEKKRKVLDEIVKEQRTINENTIKYDEENPLTERPYSPPFTSLINTNQLKSIREVNLDDEEKTKLNERTSRLEVKTYKIGDDTYMDLIYDEINEYYVDPKSKICYRLVE